MMKNVVQAHHEVQGFSGLPAHWDFPLKWSVELQISLIIMIIVLIFLVVISRYIFLSVMILAIDVWYVQFEM